MLFEVVNLLEIENYGACKYWTKNSGRTIPVSSSHLLSSYFTVLSLYSYNEMMTWWHTTACNFYRTSVTSVLSTWYSGCTDMRDMYKRRFFGLTHFRNVEETSWVNRQQSLLSLISREFYEVYGICFRECRNRHRGKSDKSSGPSVPPPYLGRADGFGNLDNIAE